MFPVKLLLYLKCMILAKLCSIWAFVLLPKGAVRFLFLLTDFFYQNHFIVIMVASFFPGNYVQEPPLLPFSLFFLCLCACHRHKVTKHAYFSSR